jgi:hypothetical protein
MSDTPNKWGQQSKEIERLKLEESSKSVAGAITQGLVTLEEVVARVAELVLKPIAHEETLSIITRRLTAWTVEQATHKLLESEVWPPPTDRETDYAAHVEELGNSVRSSLGIDPSLLGQSSNREEFEPGELVYYHPIAGEKEYKKRPGVIINSRGSDMSYRVRFRNEKEKITNDLFLSKRSS